MGEVLLVYDAQRRMQLALKRLRNPSHSSLYRFKREFRSAADLKHPNLIQLFDLGVDSARNFFYTMEFIEGPNLQEFFSTPRAPSEISGVFSAIAEGLAYLHKARKVHRDLKPLNILIANNTPKLLDFGILRELDDTANITRTSAILGTARYMSPEQALGREITPAADLYSLGCILYEHLAGEPLFSGNNAEVMNHHANTSPTPPSSKRACDPLLEELCLSLLQKDPAHRPGASQVIAFLHQKMGAPAPQTLSEAPLEVPSLVGRSQSLLSLEQSLNAVSDAPKLVLLRAEPGVGKTALLSELESIAQERGYMVWFSQCYEREEVPYKAFDRIVDLITLHFIKHPTRLFPPGSVALSRLFPMLRDVVQESQQESYQDAWTTKRNACRALFLLMSQLSGKRPPVILLDDLHWADAESLWVLRWLASAPNAPPCLLVGTYDKGSLNEEKLSLLLSFQDRVTSFAVSPLSLEDSSLLIDMCEPELSLSARDRLIQECGGSPRFLIESLRSLRETELTTVSFEALTAKRLSRMPSDARRLLEVLAVLGGRSSLSLLREILKSDSLSEPIRELSRRGFVYELGSESEEPEYDICNASLRATIYVMMPAALCTSLHKKAAEHLTDAGEPARATEHWRKASLFAQARKSAIMAARASEDSLAFDRAVTLYTTALEFVSTPDIQMLLGRALQKAGRHREAAEVFASIACQEGSAEQQDAKLAALIAHLSAGDLKRGREALFAVLNSIDEPLPSSSLALAVSTIAGVIWLFFWMYFQKTWALLQSPVKPLPDDKRWALEMYEAVHYHMLSIDPMIASALGVRHGRMALRLGDSGHIGRAFFAQALRSTALFGSLRADTVLYYIYCGEALCLVNGDKRSLLDGHYTRGLLGMLEGNWKNVKEAYEKGEALATKEGFVGSPALSELRNFYLGSLYLSGDLPALIPIAKAYLDEARDRGNVMDRADALAILAYGHLAQGNAKLGNEAFDEALRVIPVEPLSLVRLRVELLSIDCDLFRNDSDRGWHRLEDIHKRWSESGLFSTSLEYTFFQIQYLRLEVLQARTKGKLRNKPLRVPATLTARATPMSMRHEKSRAQAAFAMIQNNEKKALSFLDESLSAAERRSNRFGIAMACAGRATLLRKMGVTGADYERARAKKLFDEIGVKGCYLLYIEGWDDPT
jgi:serine/threonine protein kinase/tetratricopeptide (TPR) repeat protein